MTNLHFLGTPDLVLGITASAMSIALLILYPIPNHLKILREKSTKDLQPYQYAFTQLACFVWMFYGMSEPVKGSFTFQNILVVLVNYFCLVVQTYYLLYFRANTTILHHAAVIEFTAVVPECIFLLYIVFANPFTFWAPLLDHPHITGPAAATVGIFMYASPIPSIINACKTRTTQYLPFGLCTMYFLNAVAWFAYAYLYTPTYNVYLAIAHGGGIILEIVMLLVSCILLVTFRSSGTAMEDSTVDLEAPLVQD